MKLTVAAKCSFEPLRDLEGVRHSAGFLASLGEHPDYVRNQALVSRIQKSEHMQHTRKYPHGVRSPTEAKEEDLVALLECIHQVTVGVADVCQHPSPERQSGRG